MKRILLFFLFLVLMVPVSGCNSNDGRVFNPLLSSDGKGNAIVCYGLKTSSTTYDVYVQKIDSKGNPVWPCDGVPCGRGIVESGVTADFSCINDGLGGCFVARESYLLEYDTNSESNTTQTEYYSYICHVNALGNKQWETRTGLVDYMTGSQGNALVICDDRLIKIDTDGEQVWGQNGIHLGGVKNAVSVLATGEIDVAWIEKESIYWQRLDSSGSPLNDIPEKPVFTAPENTWLDSIRVISDGSFGPFIMWSLMGDSPDQDSRNSPYPEIFYQLIDAAGELSLVAEGVSLDICATAINARPIEPVAVRDVNDGVIIIWRDFRERIKDTGSLYAQKVNTSGESVWAQGGIRVAYTAINPNHAVIASESGGVICCYDITEDESFSLSKLSHEGTPVWGNKGLSMTIDNEEYSLCTDGNGGVYLVWSYRNRLYLRRIDSRGESQLDYELTIPSN